MSTNTERALWETLAERAAKIDLDKEDERGGPEDSMTVRRLSLAWSLNTTPTDLAMGIVADVGLVLAGVTTVGVIIWRDRTSSWQTVAAGLLLAAMIAWSGHDDVLIGAALILVVVTFAQTIWGDVQRRVVRPGTHKGPPHPLNHPVPLHFGDRPTPRRWRGGHDRGADGPGDM